MASADSAFVAYLRQHREEIDKCVGARVPAIASRDAQADDLDRYLYGPAARFVMAGGKRTRPALCLLGAHAVGAPEERAHSVAAAVELFQACALIHDDIADKSELRRGQPCLHIAEGTGIAINVGDGILVSVVSAILADDSLDQTTRLRLLDEIVVMENRTLEGQALDLGWARDERWDISDKDYLAMATRKTAYYSAAIPLAMGAICGGGTEEQIEGLRSFGMSCGLAFQLQDDLLNLVGDASAQGKDYRSDITEGKRTLVMVWALRHLDDAGRQELLGILASKTSDDAALARAVELAESCGALAHAQAYAQELVGTAKSNLNSLPIDADARKVLISMADFFVERAS
ncbi:MAG: polyprenyl synthetase family protein [Coriobacteriales bacterium]|nr:polyprenyl synthetase family protein [Coriobacteriales bacterium]